MKLRSYKNYIFMGVFLLLISVFTMKVEAKENSYKPEIQSSDENAIFMNFFSIGPTIRMVDRWKQLRYSISTKHEYFIFDVVSDISNKSRGARRILRSQYHEFN